MYFYIQIDPKKKIIQIRMQQVPTINCNNFIQKQNENNYNAHSLTIKADSNIKIKTTCMHFCIDTNNNTPPILKILIIFFTLNKESFVNITIYATIMTT